MHGMRSQLAPACLSILVKPIWNISLEYAQAALTSSKPISMVRLMAIHPRTAPCLFLVLIIPCRLGGIRVGQVVSGVYYLPRCRPGVGRRCPCATRRQ
jgi:hypothetical protein